MMISEISRNHAHLAMEPAFGPATMRPKNLPDADLAATATGVDGSWSLWGDPTGYVLIQDWGEFRILGTWLIKDDPVGYHTWSGLPDPPRGARAYALGLAALHYEAVADCVREDQT